MKAAIALLAAGMVLAQHPSSDAERTELRQRVLQKLNAILETHETPHGLVTPIPDALFDEKHNLKQAGREKLARVAGILLAYPGLRTQVEGHPEGRSHAVREYLVQQTVPADAVRVAAKHDGPVEMVVSGDAIGR